MPRSIAVLVHTRRPAAVAAGETLIAELVANGITCVIPESDYRDLPTAQQLTGVRALPDAVAPAEVSGCELVVVLGGDGTILRAAEWALAAAAPLLGVNLGHVGFLAEAESTAIPTVGRHIIERSYSVEERNTIQIDAFDDQGALIWTSFAVNEVSIEKAARERMLDLLVSIDGRPLSRWGCDGLLLATPTGSTAYAFSAGGPIIWPSVEAILLVPLSAHALFARPLVLGPQSVVDVEVLISRPEDRAILCCDGRRTTEIAAGGQVRVGNGRQRLRLARLSTSPFTARLVNKFGLNVAGWRQLEASG